MSLESLRAAIDNVRGDLLRHPIYQAVDTVPRLRVFMGHHVFAVWDFMCLAKRLQRDLTSLDTLWVPPIFGREDLIPDMFQRLLPQWAESQQARGFAYYVERHIELDGDDHGPAGLRALAEMAGDDSATWQAAAAAATSAITARIALWDGVHADILKA